MLDREGLAWIDSEARALYRHVGMPDDRAAGPRTLSARLLGTPAMVAPIRERAVLARVNGAWRVFVREGLPPATQRWLVAHELGHYWLEQRAGVREPHRRLEALCDAFGAALIAPSSVMRRALRRVGHDPGRLAELLKTTQSLALLRCGEVDGVPVALLRHRRSTIWRGDRDAVPTAWQQLGAYPDVERVEITDEPLRLGVIRR